MRLVQLIFLAATFAFDVWAQNPPKLAATARIDLTAASGVGSINNGTVLKGSGSMVRMNWLPAGDQPRTYTCSFTIIHFGWTEIVFQFTPQNSGAVEVALLGPWEQSPNAGPIYRQEVLWDSVSATN